MYMIERWLERYSPVSSISDGKPQIEGSRLLPAQGGSDPRYVYVAQGDMPVSGQKRSLILLINRNDVIHLYAEDVEAVFNRTAALFEHYQKLEYELALAVHSDDGLDRIVGMCQEELGPTYIMDPKYHILAISHPKEKGAYLATWREYETTRLVSLDSLQCRKENLLYQSIDKKVRSLTVHDKLAAPYCEQVMNSCCDRNGKVIWQCIIGFDRKTGPADHQLIDVFMSYLQAVKIALPESNGIGLSEMILDALIHRQEVRSEDILKVYDIQKWRQDAVLCVLSMSRTPDAPEAQILRLHYMTNLQQNLYQYFPSAICVQDGERLILCLEVTQSILHAPCRYISEKLIPVLPKRGFRVGISYGFRDLFTFSEHYQQACAALTFCSAEKDWMYFGECALNTRLCRSEEDSLYPHIHPLIRKLYEIDRENHTSYGMTLWQYLRYERSYVDTARKLQIHRNTVVYRIEKLKEFYPELDLTEPDEREYLLYSFRIFQTHQDPTDQSTDR